MTALPAGDLAGLLRGRPEVVAPGLLGCLLVAGSADGDVVLRVTEVEAYAGPGEDPGSHAHRGLRPRNATMFGRPGSLYVYFTYGLHWCANVVAHPVTDQHDGGGAGVGGPAGAVLVRAGEVVAGEPLARVRRPAAVRARDLARGPARLTRALGITGDDDGTDLLDPASRVRLLPAPEPPAAVASGPRVGVAGEGAATPWRWWETGGATVSAYRAAQPRRRSPRTASPVTADTPPAPTPEGEPPAPGGAP
ncbi:DNA-3-methyladenine glycosylase [Aquipuribacter hungaricus]|uniref:Putative 3-methyladenine DNA glycosylase n=2 Tax=Aquipuribacter hungaricus TaxID=545624 RepID=A0ABV7WK79_9MICO